jgi:negative regulator of sigma E activity
MTPEEFSAYIDSEIAKAEKLQPMGDDKPQQR